MKNAFKVFASLRPSFMRIPIYRFCEPLKNDVKISEFKDEHSISYTIADQVPGTFQGNSGIYMLMFTCGPCGNKLARKFTKDAYHKGVVLIRCDKCESHHLIADNLGWFDDNKWNVEQLQGTPTLKIKSEEVSALLQQFLNKQ